MNQGTVKARIGCGARSIAGFCSEGKRYEGRTAKSRGGRRSVDLRLPLVDDSTQP